MNSIIAKIEVNTHSDSEHIMGATMVNHVTGLHDKLADENFDLKTLILHA